MGAPGPPRSERVLCSARAAVLLYDDPQKQWVPAGGGPQALSCVQLFHHPGTHGFRLVGRKMQPDQQVVLNLALPRGLRYSAVTPQFHQWWGGRRLWGLSFGAPPEAAAFGAAVLRALRALEEGTPVSWPDPDSADDPSPQDRQPLEDPEHRVAASGKRWGGGGHPKTGDPPHLLPRPQPLGSRGPPRFPGGGGGGGGGGGPGFAAAIAGATLRRVKQEEAVGTPPAPPKGGGTGGGGLMEEMNAMLARRRKATLQGDKAASKRDEDITNDEAEPGTRTQEPMRRPWEKGSYTLPRMKSAAPAAPSDPPPPAEEPELERIKQELLEEMRRELQKMKEEIIEAFVMELRKQSPP
ncbi:LOW QUALITY PROTEIN: vasodilator-stimulated phosphoprotein [Melopsittacus undulatus]|uniref:LOW QUALITY PROTEIN: vasodilator-stimulated phosphoprotein n=1 Tax=Melopsittacus undulatus TaxID=13146 RepID=UPI00146C2E8C|nr:LOW QUALITY PROTEIN: vasodilator-stimulated phosphoprotein [Melopsittacus undulatus]